VVLDSGSARNTGRHARPGRLAASCPDRRCSISFAPGMRSVGDEALAKLQIGSPQPASRPCRCRDEASTSYNRQTINLWEKIPDS
jgi:hypothetical protein